VAGTPAALGHLTSLDACRGFVMFLFWMHRRKIFLRI
jgi:hypothetical protein